MKTRIALGLLASLTLLLAAAPDAEAGPKKRGENGDTAAAAKAATEKAPNPKSPKKKAATKKRTKKVASPAIAAAASASATKAASFTSAEPASKDPASTTRAVVTSPAPSKKRASAKAASAKPASATKPASVVSPEPATKRASVVSPEPATKRASVVSSTPATKQAALVTPPPATKRISVPGTSRFLASGVPLAEVREGRLAAVGTKKRPCGTKGRWAKASSRWHALDAWGRVTGTLTVGGSARDDGSGCHQVLFNEGTGHDALGVFVAVGSGYAAGPSAEWKPDADAVKRFDALYAAQEGAWVDAKIDRTREQARRRTLFFELPKQEGSPEGAPTQRRPARWAVSGGRVLLVGYVGANGAWKVGHVLSPTGKDHAYEPLAILDMNGDGLPEIVVHEEASGVYVDRVLSFDAGTMRWENAVASPGGAIR